MKLVLPANIVCGVFFADRESFHAWSNVRSVDITPWVNSITKHGITPVLGVNDQALDLLGNQSLDKVTLVHFPGEDLNPIDRRWRHYASLLEEHPEIEKVFFTDVTDVTMLREPLSRLIPEFTYIGADEPGADTKHPWIQERVAMLADACPEIATFFTKEEPRILLNAGVVGGGRDAMIRLTKAAANLLAKANVTQTTVDMLVINYLIYKQTESWVGGFPVTTLFRHWQDASTGAWFQHK